MALIDGGGTRGRLVASRHDGYGYVYAARTGSYGAVEFVRTVSLPANALVDVFDVQVTAARATLVRANEVAQVRAGPSANSLIADGGQTLVVDFGTPRTVSIVAVPSGYGIFSIAGWNGAQFMPPLYRANIASMATPPYSLTVIPIPPSAPVTRVLLPSELRTERLQIEVVGPTDADELIAGFTLVLPDAPGDLELRIDGAAPAWTHPGPVQSGSTENLSDDGWTDDGRRTVHLGDALAALTGDPTANGEQSFELKLSSRAPGLLRIDDGPQSLRRIRRARFDGDTDTTVVFDAEGEATLPLSAPGLPPTTPILGVRLRAEADFTDQRTLPAVGPAAFKDVDLSLNPELAALLRLSSDCGLAELCALRLPLQAGGEGAEVKVVLWEAGDGGPVSPLPEATTEPLALDPAAAPEWVSLVFPKPVPLNGEAPWAAVLVTRGQATLGLAWSSGVGDPEDGRAIRLGPQSGPWSPLPLGLRSGALAGVRGRLRMRGLAPREAPLPAVSVAVAGAPGPATELSPGRGGTGATLAGGNTHALRLVAYGPGSITLRDVDIITAD